MYCTCGDWHVFSLYSGEAGISLSSGVVVVDENIQTRGIQQCLSCASTHTACFLFECAHHAAPFSRVFFFFEPANDTCLILPKLMYGVPFIVLCRVMYVKGSPDEAEATWA